MEFDNYSDNKVFILLTVIWPISWANSLRSFEWDIPSGMLDLWLLNTWNTNDKKKTKKNTAQLQSA